MYAEPVRGTIRVGIWRKDDGVIRNIRIDKGVGGASTGPITSVADGNGGVDDYVVDNGGIGQFGQAVAIGIGFICH